MTARWRAWRLRRAELALADFEYAWRGTGLWGGAFAVGLKQPPSVEARALRHHARLKRRVARAREAVDRR